MPPQLIARAVSGRARSGPTTGSSIRARSQVCRGSPRCSQSPFSLQTPAQNQTWANVSWSRRTTQIETRSWPGRSGRISSQPSSRETST